MSPVTVAPQRDESSLNDPNCSRFANLRSVRWRIDLGILPASPSTSIDELRRVTADTRRRYASLRRRLLVDPHLPKDGNRSPLTMDNPLSQNPDSTWGRFFRSAELEKMVDQDLSRLYPEHGSYFQTPACQAMLRRILLLWCLKHPEYGYRQGMHELLAPLLYVVHVDLQYLSEVRALNEDYFNDEFDGMSFPDGDPVSNYRFTKSSSRKFEKDDDFELEGSCKAASIDDLDPETRNLFFLSDAYGAEGELGVILSERFVEHDAYCMFDSLMSGAQGEVAMADFFAATPVGSNMGLPPVIEASSALYHLLAVMDSSLHGHLVELGVEPQYFALRWLRVLFGREFSLNDLLLIWDELFASPNASYSENEADYSFKVLCSPRGTFICAMAVSMLLHLRSSLLATENATSCLQRLLNFPTNIDVTKLIEKAKSCQAFARETHISSSLSHNIHKPEIGRVHSLRNSSASAKAPIVPDSYWEEQWRVLHKEQAVQKKGSFIARGRIKALLGERLGLSRTESDPCPGKKDAKSSAFRCRLIEDLSEVSSKLEKNGAPEFSNEKGHLIMDVDVRKISHEENLDQNLMERTSDCTVESGENSSVFSMDNSPQSIGNSHENDSEKSSVTSNSFIADNDEESDRMDEVQDVEITNNGRMDVVQNVTEVGPPIDGEVKQRLGPKDWKALYGKFQWFLRLGKGSGEGNLDKRSSGVGKIPDSSTSGYNSCGENERMEVGDKKVTGTLKNLGQSMLENIQVIEPVFQQERGQAGSILGGKGQTKAIAALKELRKISNLLSEM